MSAEHEQGVRVTVEDLATGETKSAVICNDYVLVTVGTCYQASIQTWPKTGTHAITIKGVRGAYDRATHGPLIDLPDQTCPDCGLEHPGADCGQPDLFEGVAL